MDLNLSAFQEPRGVMRIFQFIFAICAFATTTNFSGSVDFFCASNKLASYGFSYPFRLNYEFKFDNCSGVAIKPVHIYGNFVSDAQFFVATGVLSMLFALGIAVIYAKFDEKYKSNAQWPLVDFVITVILAVLWLSGSAAWANSLTGLKMVTSHSIDNCENCLVFASNMSSLNISVILGFLNFVLWASDLWFLYKETIWFQQKQPDTATSPTM